MPAHTASLWLDYAFTTDTLDGLSIGGGVRYQGKSWADAANTLRVPDAAVFDAAVRYQKDDWTASINVANVFDKEYVKGCAADVELELREMSIADQATALARDHIDVGLTRPRSSSQTVQGSIVSTLPQQEQIFTLS